MSKTDQFSRPLRVLYSFPHKIGEGRIALTAWQQVFGAASAEVAMHVHPGVLSKPFSHENVKVSSTLSWNGFRLPYKLLGTRRTCALHDWIVSRRLLRMRDEIDLVHAWPLGALETFKVARSLGIPTLLERPNAHTRFAYEVVQNECERLGVSMPQGHEHAFNQAILDREEAEYSIATKLLCPSDFVLQTFRERGFSCAQLARHQYGFDHTVFSSELAPRPVERPFTILFAGGCAPRKGLHYALEAWLASKAHTNGVFLIAGNFIPGYAERLSALLSHPSVKRLGHRTDIHEIMKSCDAFTLPSIEEGSALVTSEARASGCVLLVSEASGAICKHNENGLVHRVGDVTALREHINSLYESPALLQRMRSASLSTVGEITWMAAGVRLAEVYRQTMAEKRASFKSPAQAKSLHRIFDGI